jgi:3D (Asp-Asp-Asp) domain-containing protein
MNRLSGRKLAKSLSSGLSVAASITVVMVLAGALDTALAGDEPKPSVARSSQVEPLDVPGSFKNRSDAKDAVTAKRSPEQVTLPSATTTGSAQLSIDAEKVTGAQNPRSLGGLRTPPRIAIDAEKVTASPDEADTDDLVDFDATAYCLKGRTASGIDTRPGVIAADPRVLPMGTVVHLRAGRYTGTYTVMDTGGRIRGRRVDVYVPTHREAVEFGRRQVKIKVMSRGSAKSARANMTPLVSER